MQPGLTWSRRMEKGCSTVRYPRNLVKARTATLNWDRLTIGEGEAAMGRQSHPFLRGF